MNLLFVIALWRGGYGRQATLPARRDRSGRQCGCAGRLFHFRHPAGQKIHGHEINDLSCLKFRFEESVVVLPLHLFEVIPRIPFPDAMVAAYALPDPCPQLLRTIFPLFILRETVELAAANETGIALVAASRFLFGAKHMKVKHRFIVFERVNGDFAALVQLHAEYRRLSLLITGTDFTIAPSAPGFAVHDLYVSSMRREELDFFLWQTLFDQKLAKVIVVGSNQLIAMMRNLRRPVCRKIEAETEEDLGTLLQLVDCCHFVDTKLLAARGALSASVPQGIQFRSNPAIRAKEVTRGITLGWTHFVPEVR